MTSTDQPCRVVVTGIGVLSPVGNSTAEAWNALVAGQSGIRAISAFDPSPYDTHIAGEVRGFSAEAWMDAREVRRTDRYTHFAMAATRQAVQDAALDFQAHDRERIGVVIGTATGGFESILANYDRFKEKGWRRMSPFFLTSMICDAAGAQVAIEYNLSGPSMGVVSACASGANALGEAAEMIRRGEADMMIAGGAEASVTPIAFAAFNIMRALSTRNSEPESASRPFDATRDGFVLAEGATVLILERAEHAVARGAHIYGEIAGYGSTVDGIHVAQPASEGRGLQRAVRRALSSAGLSPEAVGYVNTHGTGTPLNDLNETSALKAIFGEASYGIPMSSTKSMTGHMMGAAGAFETMVCLKAIENGIIPPTINLHQPDPECDLDYVPLRARQQPVEVAMTTSMGLGGHNACLVVRRYQHTS